MREERKATRVVRVLAIGSGIMVAASIAATAASAGLTDDAAPTVPTPSWEFSIQARSGTLDGSGGGGYSVRLSDVDRKVLGFQDRPGRKQDSTTVERLIKRLGLEGKQDDPPNGVISALVPPGEQRQMGVELLRAKYKRKADRLTLRVRSLAEERSIGVLPHRFGPTTVFVDGLGEYCNSQVINNTNETMTNVEFEKWDTDDWDMQPNDTIAPGYGNGWQSSGGFMRGCQNTVAWQWPNGDRVTILTGMSWNGDPNLDCTVAPSTTYQCQTNSTYSKYSSGGVQWYYDVCYVTDSQCGETRRR